MHPPGKSGWNHQKLAKEAGSLPHVVCMHITRYYFIYYELVGTYVLHQVSDT